MPKVVDHTAYRKELAQKASAIFTRFGYSRIGMRKIAEELKISKSLLYHYFSGKEDLFAACTDEVLNRDTTEPAELLIREEDSLEQRIDSLFMIYENMSMNFEGELTLMLDYLRDKSPLETADDENMKKAVSSHLSIATKVVGADKAETVLCLMIGFLLASYLSGNTIQSDIIKKQFKDLIL